MIPLSIIFSISFLFIWSGLIIGISFIESWLKFQAPNVTVSIGLGIGKIVFGALNKVEWALITLITICFLIGKSIIPLSCFLFFILIVSIVILQTFYMLPSLDKRADDHINGKTPKPSYIHFSYIFFEFVKLILIVTTGFLQIKIIY